SKASETSEAMARRRHGLGWDMDTVPPRSDGLRVRVLRDYRTQNIKPMLQISGGSVNVLRTCADSYLTRTGGARKRSPRPDQSKKNPGDRPTRPPGRLAARNCGATEP